jgi:hypothetical protein
MAEDVVEGHEIAAPSLGEARSECAPEFIYDKPHAGSNGRDDHLARVLTPFERIG